MCRYLATKRTEVANDAKGHDLAREENLDTKEITEQEPYHAAVPGDLRSTSGLGLGDGLYHHTPKWLQVWHRAPSSRRFQSEFKNNQLCTYAILTARARSLAQLMLARRHYFGWASWCKSRLCLGGTLFGLAVKLTGDVGQTNGMKVGNTKSPLEYIKEAPPIKVHGATVASYGSKLLCCLSWSFSDMYILERSIFLLLFAVSRAVHESVYNCSGNQLDVMLGAACCLPLTIALPVGCSSPI